MGARLGFLVRLVALAATALLLLAHSPTGDAEGPSCEDYDGLRLRYRVEGDCGPAGELVFVAMAGSCDLVTEGDDVGIPAVGNRERAVDGDITLGGFDLYDPQKPRDFSCSSTASEGTLSLFCRNASDRTCSATLTPAR
jgi:hypothetical protein